MTYKTKRIVAVHVAPDSGGMGTRAVTSLSVRRDHVEFSLEPPFIVATLRKPVPIGSHEKERVEVIGICLSNISWVEYEVIEEERPDDAMDTGTTEQAVS